jgi:hypothetical protein
MLCDAVSALCYAVLCCVVLCCAAPWCTVLVGLDVALDDVEVLEVGVLGP